LSLICYKNLNASSANYVLDCINQNKVQGFEDWVNI